MPLYPAIKLMDTVITPDAFDFTAEPTAPEPLEIKMKEVILSSWNSGDSPAETDIDDLAVDPTNPYAGDDDNDDLSSGELAILLLPVGVQPDDGLLLLY